MWEGFSSNVKRIFLHEHLSCSPKTLISSANQVSSKLFVICLIMMMCIAIVLRIKKQMNLHTLNFTGSRILAHIIKLHNFAVIIDSSSKIESEWKECGGRGGVNCVEYASSYLLRSSYSHNFIWWTHHS